MSGEEVAEPEQQHRGHLLTTADVRQNLPPSKSHSHNTFSCGCLLLALSSRTALQLLVQLLLGQVSGEDLTSNVCRRFVIPFSQEMPQCQGFSYVDRMGHCTVRFKSFLDTVTVRYLLHLLINFILLKKVFERKATHFTEGAKNATTKSTTKCNAQKE